MNKKEQLVAGIRDLYGKLSWLNSQKMKSNFDGLKSSEVHCIEFIGGGTDPNVTKLAASSYQTRGAMSKITKKLIKKGVIESYQKEGNKKEVHFRLTDYGNSLYITHQKLQLEFEERDRAVFAGLTDDELDFMIRFVETYLAHLGREMRKA